MNEIIPSPRIRPLSSPYAEDVTVDLAKLMPPGMAPLKLFRTLAHNPRVLRRVRRGGLLDTGSVSVRDREIVILRTTALCGAEYEWGVHAAFFAQAAGLTVAQLDATALPSPDSALWTQREQLLLRLCGELHEHSTVCDNLWPELEAEFTCAQLIELVTLAGQYHAISFVVNATRVNLEEGARRFPMTVAGRRE